MAVPYVSYCCLEKTKSRYDRRRSRNAKRNLPKYLRDGGNALVLPSKDDEGRWQFYDYSYVIMPWGFYTGIGNKLASGELGEATDVLLVFGVVQVLLLLLHSQQI